jgi:hypothetical protein
MQVGNLTVHVDRYADHHPEWLIVSQGSSLAMIFRDESLTFVSMSNGKLFSRFEITCGAFRLEGYVEDHYPVLQLSTSDVTTATLGVSLRELVELESLLLTFCSSEWNLVSEHNTHNSRIIERVFRVKK